MNTHFPPLIVNKARVLLTNKEIKTEDSLNEIAPKEGHSVFILINLSEKHSVCIYFLQ